jgi:hypothetical protein
MLSLKKSPSLKDKAEELVPGLPGRFELAVEVRRSYGGSILGYTLPLTIEAAKVNDPETLAGLYGKIQAERYEGQLVNAGVTMFFNQRALLYRKEPNASFVSRNFPLLPRALKKMLKDAGVKINPHESLADEFIYEDVQRLLICEPQA